MDTLVEFTAPTEEPVTAAEFRSHARVDENTEDTLIGYYIKTARQIAEEYCNRSFVTTTWKRYMDCWPDTDVITLPKSKVSAVSSITYYDEDGTQRTWSSSQYDVDLSSQPARIVPAVGYTFPTLRAGKLSPICITFVAGYGAADTVPEGIKTAIKFMVSHLFENREPGDLEGFPKHIRSLLQPFRVM